MAKERSEEGKRIRKLYKNDEGVPYQACKAWRVNLSGACKCITTFTTDQYIMEMKTAKHDTEMEYKESPTKEDLLEFFTERIRIRKMTEREAFRLMDVEDSDIDKMLNATETITLKNGKTKTKKAISKTAAYKLAGNSICVGVLTAIFRTLFIANQPENKPRGWSPSLF